jgi:hypothetical protein
MKYSWAIIAGAGLMYLNDPQMGKRRRALVRDKLVRATHKIDEALDVTRRDLTNRTGGFWSEMRVCFTSSVRGVSGVENRLEAHDEPAGVPGLQGEPRRRRSGERFEFMQTYWSPSARLLAGAAVRRPSRSTPRSK